jgi:hypothetical protein
MNKNISYERTNIIPILKKPSSSIKNDTFSNNYSLNSQIIDPFKSSPPNEFMKKLKNRMDKY